MARFYRSPLIGTKDGAEGTVGNSAGSGSGVKPDPNSHTHSNKAVLDKINVTTDGNMTFQGRSIWTTDASSENQW